MQDEVVSPDRAWQAYRALRSDRGMGYLRDPRGLDEVWDTFTQGGRTSPNLWTDAYPGGLAHAAGLTLATFDSKTPFRTGLACLVLEGDG